MSTKLGKILADFTTSLATDIAVAGTTATLSSATDDDGVALPSGRYFFTIDGSNSSKEHISCDLVGTALTNIKSLSRQGVETTGTARKHRIGASVSLTDFGHIKFINDLVSGTTNLDSSAPLGYDGAPSSLTGNQLATVTYVLGVVNGGTVTFDQQVISNQTSGEALTANDIVYFKESDQKWWKADADLTTTFDQLQVGVALATVSSNATVQIAISGPVSGFTGLTAGSKYYLSNTAGAITTTAGTYSVFIGWALTTTTILFNPLNKTAPTQKEKDALVGSQGIPTSSNKYVTQDNTTDGLTDQEQATQNGTVELGEADATTKKNKIAQSFIPTKTKIRGVNIYKSADTGTFTGTVTVSIQADSSGSPSGSALATVTLTNSEWLTKAVGDVEVIFASEYASMTVGSLYWIVIESSTSDNSNHPNVGTNTAGGYASGSAKYKNTTDSWVAISTIDLYFKTIEGTASQVVLTNTSGKIESTFYSVSEMPQQAFSQTIALPVQSGNNPGRASGSNTTGSVIYAALTTNNELYRFERDSKTGQYFQTHNVNMTTPIPNGDGGGIIEIGSYIYVFYNNGTNIICYRYLAADLTGEQSMTVPTVGCTQITTAWTDGVYAYIVSDSSATTSRKWSVSGTTFSAVSTATVTNAIFDRDNQTTMFDGNNVYVVHNDTGAFNLTIQKLSSIDGTSYTTTIIKYLPMSDSDYGGFAINIDTDRMYIGTSSVVYDEAAQIASYIRLIPVTKP
jgi:hypothetical protein